MAFDGKALDLALEEVEASKGISKETALNALKEAMARGFRKELGGDDAKVVVNIDPANDVLEMYYFKDIVEDVEDDFLQITLEEAKDEEKNGHGVIVGNEFRMYATVDQLRKSTAMSIKSIFKQKSAEAEKGILYEAFKDKIGTMITGRVEKSDERGCQVNIGRTSVYLPKNHMIGDERYGIGDQIRLYINDVANGNKNNQIVVTRANDGFLRCIFEEEIREVYDHTIEIVNIAREAGERSKVAVKSANPDIDPAGTCIGPNGTRIQKIVAQLGNGNSKEKIDIIAWSDNPCLFIMESLKPAQVVGIIYDADSGSSTVIVKDDSFSLAIGRRGCNVRLASKLTGHPIDIKTETEAVEEDLKYQTYEELQALAIEARNKASNELRFAQYSAAKSTEVLPGLPEGYVAPQQRVYADEETSELDEALESKVDDEILNEVIETPIVTPTKEEVKTEQPQEEFRSVKTTTTLSDLEKSIEDKAAKESKSSNKKSFSKKKKEEVEDKEEEVKTISDPASRMSIYTEEELREFEEEDKENDSNVEEEDNIDYEEYDEYYDK